MKKISFFILIVVLIYSCNPHVNEIQEKSKKELVLILKNSATINTNIGSGVSIDDFNRLDYDTEKRNDTIIIDIENYRKLYLKNENTFNSIICATNDTLNIEILNNKTNIHFSNRTLRKYDTIPLTKIFEINSKKELIDFYKHKKKYLVLDSISGMYILNEELVVLDSKNYRNLISFSNKLILKKKEILSSLLNRKLISEPNFNFEVSTLKAKYLKDLFDDYKITSDTFYRDTAIDFIEKNNIFQDNFINYSVMNQFVKTIVLENDFEITNTGINYNFKKSLDLLPVFFSGENLRVLWEFTLYKMAEQRGGISELIECFNNYKSKYAKTKFIELFNEKYIIDLKSKNYNNDNISLIELKSNKKNLNDIINENKGKLIYIDFWASWCGPCRAVMPASKVLSKDYENKDVVFIYISIDKNFEKWEKASKEESISLSNYNFLAINYPNADFYNELELTTIPRYLLYDKKGKLIYRDSPGPEGEEIRKLFDRYLEE